MSHCASSTTSPRSQDVTASSRVATTPSATANSLDSINSSHNSNNSFQQSSVRLTTSAALHKTTIESSTSRNTSSTSSSSTDDAPMLRQPVLDSNSLDELLLLRHFSCFETTIFNFFPIFPPSNFDIRTPTSTTYCGPTCTSSIAKIIPHLLWCSNFFQFKLQRSEATGRGKIPRSLFYFRIRVPTSFDRVEGRSPCRVLKFLLNTVQGQVYKPWNFCHSTPTGSAISKRPNFEFRIANFEPSSRLKYSMNDRLTRWIRSSHRSLLTTNVSARSSHRSLPFYSVI